MARKPRAPKAKKESRTLGPEDHEFIRQMLAGPDDDAPRLAYADWLAEQGERDRAEFIRCQIEAARLAPQDPRREEAAARANQLLQAHEAEWLEIPSELREAGRVCCFERGFTEWARCCINYFAEDIAARFPLFWQVAPITRLEFYDLNAAAVYDDAEFEESWLRVENYEAVANMPQLVHVRTLSLGECSILDRHLKPLLASPHLTNLRELQLMSNRLGDAGARVVAESPRAAGLTHLDLNTNEIGDQGAMALAQSAYLTNLKTLDLRFNFIGEEGGRALARSPHFSNLERLDLGGTQVGAAEGELRQRFGDRVTL
jgi:uncharacterized protein (TIGR02996 family)